MKLTEYLDDVVHKLPNGKYVVAHWSHIHSEWRSYDVQSKKYVRICSTRLDCLVGAYKYKWYQSACHRAREIYNIVE